MAGLKEINRHKALQRDILGRSRSGAAKHVSGVVSRFSQGRSTDNSTWPPHFARTSSLTAPKGPASFRRTTVSDAHDRYANVAVPDNAHMMKLQMAMQRMNLVFTALSNIMKTRHDTAKSSMGNIR